MKRVGTELKVEWGEECTLVSGGSTLVSGGSLGWWVLWIGWGSLD